MLSSLVTTCVINSLNVQDLGVDERTGGGAGAVGGGAGADGGGAGAVAIELDTLDEILF